MLPSVLFYNVSPPKISNHNAFYNFLLAHQCICALSDQKLDRNKVIKRHYTSAEAVKLFEEDDNKVFKLLKDQYSSSEASSSDSESISDNDSNELFSSDEDSLTCVPDTPQKLTKTSPLINM